MEKKQQNNELDDNVIVSCRTHADRTMTSECGSRLIVDFYFIFLLCIFFLLSIIHAMMRGKSQFLSHQKSNSNLYFFFFISTLKSRYVYQVYYVIINWNRLYQIYLAFCRIIQYLHNHSVVTGANPSTSIHQWMNINCCQRTTSIHNGAASNVYITH